MSVVTIERKVLEKNDAMAAQNRARFREHGLFVFNSSARRARARRACSSGRSTSCATGCGSA